MRIELEKELRALGAWDLAVCICGKDYPIRPLVMADLKFLADMQAGRVDDIAKIEAFYRGLFMCEEPPELGGLELMAMYTIVGIASNHAAQIAAGHAVKMRRGEV